MFYQESCTFNFNKMTPNQFFDLIFLNSSHGMEPTPPHPPNFNTDFNRKLDFILWDQNKAAVPEVGHDNSYRTYLSILDYTE